MAKKYISLGRLSIASELLNFVNSELLPGTGVDKKKFWFGLDKCAHELSAKNKNLLEFREILQKKIDIWHRNKKGSGINAKKYFNFLKEIGYLKKEGILIIAGSLNKLKRNGSTLSNLSGPPRLNKITAFFIYIIFSL